MRGALQTLTRLNAVRCGLATAAFLALITAPGAAAWAGSPSAGTGSGANSSPATPADGTDADERAYAVPRDAPLPEMEVVLPQPLPPSAVAQYDRILTLQAHGAYAAADAMLGRLQDRSLVGPVLADRYLSDGYRSAAPELTAWLAAYGDQPAAPAIYALLRRKSPGGARAFAPPRPSLLPEITLAPAGAARPSPAADNALWRKTFMRGLDAWQRGDAAAAQPLFARAAGMKAISDDDRAAAAFWSARVALRLQRPVDYLDWLHRASLADATFYGMLAGRLLGQDFAAEGIGATLTEADITAVDATPQGHLAFALLQVGATAQAQTALRALWPGIREDPAFAHSVLAVAVRAGMLDIAIAIAGEAPTTGNAIADARLPLPALHPTGGFTVDPPLIYALTRTESGFDSSAVSAAGARGLMQLMPVTASFIARNRGVGSADSPSVNLALGQDYLRYLGEQRGIDENLLAILASYNAGPNAAAGWQGTLRPDSDPLIFIETIPNAQTRRFVHQVLADSWIYAAEIGLRPGSLDAIAEGNFPQLGDTRSLAALH